MYVCMYVCIYVVYACMYVCTMCMYYVLCVCALLRGIGWGSGPGRRRSSHFPHTTLPTTETVLKLARCCLFDGHMICFLVPRPSFLSAWQTGCLNWVGGALVVRGGDANAKSSYKHGTAMPCGSWSQSVIGINGGIATYSLWSQSVTGINRGIATWSKSESHFESGQEPCTPNDNTHTYILSHSLSLSHLHSCTYQGVVQIDIDKLGLQMWFLGLYSDKGIALLLWWQCR